MAKRYMVVTHPIADEKLAFVDGKITGKQPIHNLVNGYHWARLDATHIIMLAGYPLSNHIHIHTHEKVSVLPTHSSSKSVKMHLTQNAHPSVKDAHIASLHHNLGMSDDCTMDDLIDTLVAKHGVLFALTQ
jgi:hypothetical protein